MAKKNSNLVESFSLGREEVLEAVRCLKYKNHDGLVIHAINTWEKKHDEYVNLIPRYESALIERKINIADRALRKPVNALLKTELDLFPKLELLEQSDLDEVIAYAKSVTESELLCQIGYARLLDDPYTAYHMIKTRVEVFEWDNKHLSGRKSFLNKMDCLPPQTEIRTRSSSSSSYDYNY